MESMRCALSAGRVGSSCSSRLVAVAASVGEGVVCLEGMIAVPKMCFSFFMYRIDLTNKKKEFSFS